MFKKIILLPIFTLAFHISQPLFADTSEKASSMCSCHKHHEKLATALQLDSAQIEKIRVIREQAKANLTPKFQQLKAIRLQMNNLVASDKMDESKLTDLINQKTSLSASITKTRLSTKHQIYQVLNQKQQQQYQTRMNNWNHSKKMHGKNCHCSYCSQTKPT